MVALRLLELSPAFLRPSAVEVFVCLFCSESKNLLEPHSHPRRWFSVYLFESHFAVSFQVAAVSDAVTAAATVAVQVVAAEFATLVSAAAVEVAVAAASAAVEVVAAASAAALVSSVQRLVEQQSFVLVVASATAHVTVGAACAVLFAIALIVAVVVSTAAADE